MLCRPPPSFLPCTASYTGWPSPISTGALGASHSLVVAGGRVFTFGVGMGLGLEGSGRPRYIPTEIPGLTDVRDVCAGKDFSLALLNNGSLLTWGTVGGVRGSGFELPTEVESPEGGDWNGTVSGIACGEGYRAGWTDRGALYTWGSNENRQCCIGHSQEQAMHQMTGEAPLRIAMPTQVEALKDVKVVGAVGYRDQLLVLPEDPGMFFLCGNQKKPENSDEEKGPEEMSPKKVLLHSIRGLKNHTLVGAALGELDPQLHLYPPKVRRYIFLIVEHENERRRRLFFMDADGKEMLTPKVGWNGKGESLYDFDFSDKGGLPLDVLEVGIQKNRALVLLSDNSVRAFKVEVEEMGSARFIFDPHLVVEKPVPVEALHNSALRLTKTISVGTNWIVITKDGPMGPFLPDDHVRNETASYGIGEDKSSPKLHSFSLLERPVLAKGTDGNTYYPRKWVEMGDYFHYKCNAEAEQGLLYPPEAAEQSGSICTQEGAGDGEASLMPPLDEVECRGCEVPAQWNGTILNRSTLPFSVTQKRRTRPHAADQWEAYKSGTPIGIGWTVQFACSNGKLSYKHAECSVDGDRSTPALSPNETEVLCYGCRVPEGPSSVFLPLKMEVRKKAKSGPCEKEAESEGEEGEGEEREAQIQVQEADEWREYEQGEAIGVGDRLRLRCDSGVLCLSDSHQKADERFSTSGVECRWSAEAYRDPTFQYLSEASKFHCKGCSVPVQWLRGERPEGSRYIVDILSIHRAGSEERKSFQPNMTTAVAINDTLFFTCPKGGVLHIDGKPKVWGGATCVDPFGSREFDVDVSDVKCVRSTGAILLRNFLLAFVALLVTGAVWVLVWYDSKEKWRLRRIARRLNLQRLVVPPEGADVSEMITEKPRSLAEQETRARRRA
uniref:Uncharacterized protein n=1 Tax=Chromera velia CCMP2878 TaxID=1169474 RepID=A0A0G4F9E2_9ALVE|eukprot:Cvel_15754.t1-p1 / transcript=Cvel_15754.t1 / gene=Cvel_15754 / organism=Chromera_velia_CCMP2878 / gene_product=Serine/threonine-protein kinase Nek8, putative / transcript_product=Serine/threonine-protein kinase Nek8, putative / location=Cvel_scaffold1180:5371-11719(+) / protein_length=893 / sequence_SO=supercontig / SO=protein_coding / is_pseudo=false